MLHAVPDLTAVDAAVLHAIDEIRHGLWFFDRVLFDDAPRVEAELRRLVPDRSALGQPTLAQRPAHAR